MSWEVPLGIITGWITFLTLLYLGVRTLYRKLIRSPKDRPNSNNRATKKS